MFTHLGLKNFRAFEELDLGLAPVTVLVGPNNAGKSSIISALRILAQTVISEDFRVPLLLNGPLGDFGTYKDVVYENDRRRAIGMTLGVGLPGRTAAREVLLDLNFAYRMQRREVILRGSTMYDQDRNPVFTSRYSGDTEKQTIQFLSQKMEALETKPIQRRLRTIHFLVPIWQLATRLTRLTGRKQPPIEIRKALALADAAFREFLHGLRSIEYLGPFRKAPERTNLFSGESPTTVGMDGAKAIDILASDYLRRGRKKKKLLNPIIRWLRSAEIATDIKVRVLSDRHYEMLVRHPVTGEFQNLADVGYGSSQVLPVIAAGYNLVPGSTFIVEQPEIHLHPKAQAELGTFLAGLYERNIQCIVETHSEHLILRLQKHVATGLIRPRDIIVYFVYARGRKKEVTQLTIGEDGIFKEKWPRGFFEERLQEVTELARASLAGAE